MSLKSEGGGGGGGGGSLPRPLLNCPLEHGNRKQTVTQRMHELEFFALCFLSQVHNLALMENFVWLMDQLKVLAEWRFASMECGEQCVVNP